MVQSGDRKGMEGCRGICRGTGGMGLHREGVGVFKAQRGCEGVQRGMEGWLPLAAIDLVGDNSEFQP